MKRNNQAGTTQRTESRLWKAYWDSKLSKGLKLKGITQEEYNVLDWKLIYERFINLRAEIANSQKNG